MKNFFLIISIVISAIACSDNPEKKGTINYAFSDTKVEFAQLARALYDPCPAEILCQTVLLRKGTQIPSFPFAHINDVIGIYVYDKERFDADTGVLVAKWNCDFHKRDEDDCLTVEQLNELLEPYTK